MADLSAEDFSEVDSWNTAAASSLGYSDKDLVSRMTDKFKSSVSRRLAGLTGNGHLGRLSDRDLHLLTAWSLTVRGQIRVSVVDVGGGNGYFYDTVHKSHGGFQEIDWLVLESEAFATAYEEAKGGLPIKFAASGASESSNENMEIFDLSIFSCVLQYLEEPFLELRKHRSRFALIMRLPILNEDEDRFFVQHVKSQDYGEASWPMRIFSKSKFEENLRSQWEVVATMVDHSESFFSNGVWHPMSSFVLKSRQHNK
jgi:putative methyltransferase (TIGR04325 family)